MNNYTSMRYIVEQYRINFRNDLKELSSADINIYYEVWDDVTQEYKLSNTLPGLGYEYESISFCVNDSELSYSNGKVYVAAKGKDYCYAYFRNANELVTYRIYTKELDDPSDFKGNFVRSVPDNTFEFTSYSCTNNEVVTFDAETRLLSVNATNKTTCEVIFTRKDTNVTLNIYNESPTGSVTYLGKKYEKVDEIPKEGYTFDTYTCVNSSVTTIITYEDNELEVRSSDDNECSLYFNVE